MILATGNGITKSFLSLEELPLKYSINISIVFKGSSCFALQSHKGSWLNKIPSLKWESENSMSDGRQNPYCQELYCKKFA